MEAPHPPSGQSARVQDLALAVKAGCAVLITASPDEALDLARTIAAQAGAGQHVRVCDFGESGSASSGSYVPPDAKVVLLREVQQLTHLQQLWLLELLEKGPARGASPRIMASSSVSLFSRVEQGAFDARLFYRLNAVHLVVPGPRPVGRSTPAES